MAFLTKHKKLLLGVAIGYILARQFGARIEMQLQNVVNRPKVA